VTDNNLNKKYFTEEDSPVSLIPTDAAWDHMREKINTEMPDKKKRRFFIWIPPVGCAMFILLGAAVLSLLFYHHTATFSHSNKKNAIAFTNQSIDSSLNKRSVTSNENSIQKEQSHDRHKHLISEQTPPKRTTLTANSATGSMRQSATQHFRKKTTKRVERGPLEEPIETNPEPLWPSSTVLSNSASISIEAKRSLPVALLSPAPSPDSTHKTNLFFSAGLEWQVPVPFNGFKYSLKGPDGKDQLYRVLLPGVWLSANKGRQRIIATVNPFVNMPMPDKNYGLASVLLDPARSVIVNKRMVKIFGCQAGLSYSYQFQDHWRVGARVDGNWWKKALVLAQPNDSSGTKPFLYSVNAKDEEKMKSFQLSGNIQLSWQRNAWEGLLQLSTPFSTTLRGIPSPVWLRLGVRWRLFGRLQEK